MSEINVTPLVDVMLVLLIIFMVAAPLMTVGVPIKLPETAAKEMNADTQPITVSINKDGQIHLQETEVAYDDVVAKLEAIVDSMESGEVPLAELLAKYEEGSKLLKTCEGRLKEAELKIEKLKKAKDGSAAFEPFESTRAE